MDKQVAKQIRKVRRAARSRAKLFGTASRPRLSVFKSNLGLYAQLIDDEAGQTLVSAHTKQLQTKGNKTTAAEALGKAIAEKAKTAKISQVVFDRGPNVYHGRIKAVAEAARANGLEF